MSVGQKVNIDLEARLYYTDRSLMPRIKVYQFCCSRRDVHYVQTGFTVRDDVLKNVDIIRHIRTDGGK